MWSILTALVFFSICIGNLGVVKQFLSTRLMRAFGRVCIITCVFEIFIIDTLFFSDNAPDGIYLTKNNCFVWGLGFVFITLILACFIHMLVEFPI